MRKVLAERNSPHPAFATARIYQPSEGSYSVNRAIRRLVDEMFGRDLIGFWLHQKGETS